MKKIVSNLRLFNFLSHHKIVVIFFILLSNYLNAQVSLTATLGTSTGNFTTLKGAFDAINLGTHKGVIAITLNGDTTETGSSILYSSGTTNSSYSSISIQPNGARTINGWIGLAQIDLNGADNVTIDGLNANGNSLTIINRGNAPSLIRFINDATYNTITNCTLNGYSTSSGLIYFATASLTGNDNNTISNNTLAAFATGATFTASINNQTLTVTAVASGFLDIGQEISGAGIVPGTYIKSVGTGTGGTGTYGISVYHDPVSTRTFTSAGTSLLNYAINSSGTAAKENSENIIDGNIFENIFRNGVLNASIYVAANNSAWTITNNKIFQSVKRSCSVLDMDKFGIYISSGSGYTVSGNTIGFGNSSGTGTTNYVSNDLSIPGFPTLFTPGTAASFRAAFYGIHAQFTAGGANSVIKSNTIAGVALFSMNFVGINLASGNATVGGPLESDGNIIGSTTGPTSGTPSIYVCGTTQAGSFSGISCGGANTITVQNNKIGDIMCAGATSSIAPNFTGISNNGAANLSIINNTIGNDVANNIKVGVYFTGTNLSNSAATATATTSGSGVNGISTILTGNNVSINNNTIKGFQLTGTTVTFNGISTSGVLTGTTPALTINNNSIGNATQGVLNYAFANSGQFYGISVTNTTASNTLSTTINNNNFQGISHSVASTNPICFIAQTGNALTETINSNTFTSLSLATTGALALIYNDYVAPSNGSKTVQNNQVVNSFVRNAACTNFFYGYYDNLSSVSWTCSNTISGNNFSNVNTGSGGTGSAINIYGFYLNNTNNFNNTNVYNNTINNWIIGTGSPSNFYGFHLNGFGGTAGSPNLVYGNTVSNCTSDSNSLLQHGIYVGPKSLYLNVYNNIIRNNAITRASSAYFGIYAGGSNNNNKFYNNTITGLTSTTTSTLYGIYILAGTQMDLYRNTINTFSSLGSVYGIYVAGGTTINTYQQSQIGTDNFSIYGLSSTGTSTLSEGIRIAGGITNNIYQNTLYNISGTNGVTISGIDVSNGATTNIYKNKMYSLTGGIVNGILIAAGTTQNIYNNLIGGLTAPTSGSIDGIRGISITNTITSSQKVYNNTIYLSGSGGTNFGGSGIYHTASNVAATSNLDLQNNIIINNITPSGTGKTVAYRISFGGSNYLANYAATSNKNLFYAGTPGANNLIYFDPAYQLTTIAQYKAGVILAGTIAPRDANSFTEASFNPSTFFVSTNGADPNYLQIPEGVTTQAESGGNTIALCSPDYNEVVRPLTPGTAYDVGAWEFAGVAPRPVFSNLVSSPALTPRCTKVARAISIVITIPSGSISSATLSYSHNGTAQSVINMTSSGTTWSGTMLAPTVGNANVTWTITATGSNGLTSTYSGASYADEPVNGSITSVTAASSPICEDTTTTLTANGVVGSNPIITWWTATGGTGTNLGIGSTLVAGPGTYYARVTSDCGAAVEASLTVDILYRNVIVSVTGASSICPGSTTTLTANGVVGTNPVITWWSATGGTGTNLGTGSTLTTGPGNYYARVTGDCGAPVESNFNLGIIDKTWLGTINSNWETAGNWTCGTLPTSTDDTFIGAGNYNPIITSNVSVKSINLINGTTLTVATGSNISLSDSVVNNGTFIVQSNANLIQTSNATNSGNVIINRNSALMQLFDYTLWSSPVANQNLLNFSSDTVPTRFYSYNSATNLFSAIQSPSSTNFVLGNSYLIRAPNNWIQGATPVHFSGQFIGVPNNGMVNITNLSSNSYYAIGNPYPSTILADSFLNTNSTDGTLYFWRKTNNAASTSYATYTLAGGTGTAANTGSNSSLIPNGIIQVGQGFIVKTGSSATSLNFNNSMRTIDNANQFLRSNGHKSRYWLNLSSSAGFISQTMVAYMDQATVGIDNGIDGLYFNDSSTALTSIIQNFEFAIQGKPLPFETNDTVPLGFKSSTSGIFSIGLDHVDGLFSSGQTIYLKDNLSNTCFDLGLGNYEFQSNSGTFNNRFEITYSNLLNNAGFSSDHVMVYAYINDITINSANQLIDNIKTYDVTGSLLDERVDVNSNEVKFKLPSQNQILFLKIMLANGNLINKKIINQ